MKRSLLIASLIAITPAAFAVEFGPGAGQTFIDNDTVSSDINIGMGVTAVNYVRIVGLNHTWIGDLTITLTNPDATSAFVIHQTGDTTLAGFGDSTNLDGDYTFVAGGADIWAAAAGLGTNDVIAPGDYSPFVNNGDGTYTLTDFSSLVTGTAGDWTLSFEDTATGDTGSFSEWYIDVDPVPEPGTMILLGAGAAALVARRRRKA